MSRTVSKLSQFIIFSVLAFACLAAYAQTAAPEPNAPPVQWPRSHNYDVQHYKIKVRFDWKEKSVAGETTITLKPFPNDLSEVELDAGQMDIKSVKLAPNTPLKFRYVNNQKLIVTLDKKYAANTQLAIRVNYVAKPVNNQAIAFITPTATDKQRPYQIWSQGEAQTNHYWFPCYDAPNDKATSELIATVEDKYQVISNGKLISVQANPANRTKTFHWVMNQPFSSYLISVIVGEYAEVKDRFKTTPVSSFVYKNQVQDARVSLGKLPQMVAFFSKKLAYDFPYPKYAQIMVHDFPGAMENITATSMTDTAVHDKRAHLDLSSDEIVAHELAHSWFGNLLTCRDWGELWLNESFATFMEAAWTEHDKGRDDYLYQMYTNQQGYFQAWDNGLRRPIVTKLYSDPDGLFDAYAYPRGAAVINMLRFVLGEEMFWKAIRHYIRKHQWQNVETQQLVVAIEETTGQNLQWFFDEWLYKMGHPEFEVVAQYDEGAKSVKLTVKQGQKADEQRKWFDSPAFFTMPVDLAITTAAGEKVHRVLINKAEQEFVFPADSKPLFINFDKGNYLIKQVTFNRSDEELIAQLLKDSDVMGRVLAAVELKDHNTDAVIKALAQAATKDRFRGVRLEATKSLAELKNAAAKAALLEILQDKDAPIRRAAIKGLGNFKDASLADTFIKTINTDPSYFAIADAARALGQTASPQAYGTLLAALKMDSHQDTIRAGALGGLAALKDPRSLDIALQYAAPTYPLDVRINAVSLLGALGKGNERAIETLLATFKEESPSLQLKFTVLQAFSALGDVRAIPFLEKALKEPGLPPFAVQFLTNTINQLKNPTKE
jgi:aminopeptidase N